MDRTAAISGGEAAPPPPPSRPMCADGCGRPKRVCICSQLPEVPIPTVTTVVVLQHPHELRRRLATAPLLPRCLLNCSLIPGRRLRQGSHPILDSLHDAAADPPAALFLFPRSAPGAKGNDVDGGEDDDDDDISSHRGTRKVLIVFDGTWKHAAEMVRASLPFLRVFARRVSLAGGRDRSSGGASMFESELALRKEPHRGCLSTAEAVARALGALEPDGSEGRRAESALLAAIRAMVALQMEHLAGKTVVPRPRRDPKQRDDDRGGPPPHSICSTK